MIEKVYESSKIQNVLIQMLRNIAVWLYKP